MSLKNTLRKAEKALRLQGPLSARTARDEPSAGRSLTVSGPYPNCQKFRLIVTDATGANDSATPASAAGGAP